LQIFLRFSFFLTATCWSCFDRFEAKLCNTSKPSLCSIFYDNQDMINNIQNYLTLGWYNLRTLWRSSVYGRPFFVVHVVFRPTRLRTNVNCRLLIAHCCIRMRLSSRLRRICTCHLPYKVVVDKLRSGKDSHMSTRRSVHSSATNVRELLGESPKNFWAILF